MLKKYFLCLAAFLILLTVGAMPSKAVVQQLIIVNKQTNELGFYENGRLVRVFKVATGKEPSFTPEGKFQIVNKIKNRTYYKGKIKGGDPRNPLGTRWLGIDARGTSGTTYAIHGTNNPSSIGTYASDGCIRMYNHEIEWLFDQVKNYTTVIITSSSKSFDDIAKRYGYSVFQSSLVEKGLKNILIKKGSRGKEVKEVQMKLSALGYSTNGIDGIFGSGTEKAVRQFQMDHRLTPDGIVGKKTYQVLFERYSF